MQSVQLGALQTGRSASLCPHTCLPDRAGTLVVCGQPFPSGLKLLWQLLPVLCLTLDRIIYGCEWCAGREPVRE